MALQSFLLLMGHTGLLYIMVTDFISYNIDNMWFVITECYWFKAKLNRVLIAYQLYGINLVPKIKKKQ